MDQSRYRGEKVSDGLRAQFDRTKWFVRKNCGDRNKIKPETKYHITEGLKCQGEELHSVKQTTRSHPQRSVVDLKGSCPVGLKVQVNVRKEACDEGGAFGELEGQTDISLG